MTIVNVRGTTGSGKSRIAKMMLEAYEHETLYEPGFGKKRQSPIAYRLPGNLFIVGRYEDNSTLGCDGLHVEVVHDIIKYFIASYENAFIYCEGLSLSTSGLSRWVELRDQVQVLGQDLLVGFLDTTVEQCIANIWERRKVRGGPHGQDDRPLNEQAINEHHSGVLAQRERCIKVGLNVVDIDNTNSFNQIIGLYKSYGWDPERVRDDAADVAHAEMFASIRDAAVQNSIDHEESRRNQKKERRAKEKAETSEVAAVSDTISLRGQAERAMFRINELLTLKSALNLEHEALEHLIQLALEDDPTPIIAQLSDGVRFRAAFKDHRTAEYTMEINGDD